MKKATNTYLGKYETPTLRFCSIDLCAFICVSEIYGDIDELESEYGGELMFE